MCNSSDIDSSTHKAKFILPKGSYSLIIRTKSSPTNLCKRRECLNVICDNINYKVFYVIFNNSIRFLFYLPK